MRSLLLSLGLALIAGAGSGCASVARRMCNDTPRVLPGVLTDLREVGNAFTSSLGVELRDSPGETGSFTALRNTSPWLQAGVCMLDLPFSLALDAVFFPFDLLGPVLAPPNPYYANPEAANR